MSFNYEHFHLAVFAAFVRRDLDALGNALAIFQDVTGTSLIEGDPTQEEVFAWAGSICEQLARDGAYLDAHGEAPPHLQCDNPRCRTHGMAVRARLARAHAARLQASGNASPEQPSPERGTVVLLPAIPGEH